MTAKKKEESKSTQLASFYDKLLDEEFQKETDRGAVILAASLFEIQLESLLKSYLVPDASSKDELFESVTAPLSNFSSKILAAYRLGLISKKFARDLNLIRKIRNEFAHNIHGCTFEHSSVKSRIHELGRSSNIQTKSPIVRTTYPDGTRGDFLICISWMLWALTEKTEYVEQISESEEEWGYLDLNESATLKKIKAEQRRKAKKDAS